MSGLSGVSRIRVLAGVAFAFCFRSALVLAGPSFDCTKARQPDEFTICATPALAELDNIVAAGYGYLKAR